ncbi:MAG: hypothetical protein PUD59_02465, partial [bacterium]|nr:hypothetical protein [bacterium]
TAALTFEYGQAGRWHWLGKPFQPERHTWVGVRLGLFVMPLGGDGGGYADFGCFRVTGVETAE